MSTTEVAWPILIISGQFNEPNDEGFRLRELEEELINNQHCKMIPSLTYEDGYKIFRSRADFGCIVIDWDIPFENKKEKIKAIEIVRLMRKRNKKVNLEIGIN